MAPKRKSDRSNAARTILAVVTSTPEYASTGYRTGLWLGELTHFVDKAEKAGFDVEIASVGGGFVPLDPESLTAPMLALGGTGKRYEDRAFMDRLTETVAVADVDADDYAAIYLTGGHGTMYDFDDADLAALVSAFAAQGKVVSAVCHGPSGLLQATNADGSPLLKGRRATGFAWAEEKLAGRRKAVPFRLDQAMRKAGARYAKARVPMTPKVIRDGQLVTGQNPMSAGGVADEVIKLLKGRKRS